MINMHCRTTFYTALGRLLMVELGEDEEQFERFMMPLRGAWQVFSLQIIALTVIVMEQLWLGQLWITG